MLGIEGPEAEQVALDHTVTNIPTAEMALLDFTVKLNNHPREVSRLDIDALRGHGFADQHILEATIMVGLAKFANFVSFGLGTVPDFDSSRVARQLGLEPVSDRSEKELNPSSGNFTLINEERIVTPGSVVDEDTELVQRTRAGVKIPSAPWAFDVARGPCSKLGKESRECLAVKMSWQNCRTIWTRN